MYQYESLLKAEEEIKPYLSVLKDCYDRALVKYNSFLDFFAAPMYNRCKATNFQNIIINEIKTAFAGVDGVEIREKFESISLLIKNRIAARFKKFNAKGLPSNHRSKRNDAIIAQQLLFDFSDYPPVARVDIGYTLDITGTTYDLLKIICRRNKNIVWEVYFHDIENRGSADAATSVISPTTPEAGGGFSRINQNEETEKKKAE